jgi:hypothetical protein
LDFLSDLEKIILEKINKMGIKINYNDIHELVMKYLNIKIKTIDKIPRQVFYSNELNSSILGKSYYNSIKCIEKKFENGDNINPYLSKFSIKPNSQDGLLNDWGIYHLHLSDSKDDPTDYFYSRSDFLLMLIVTPDSAYFIDVRPHSESNDPNDRNFSLWVRHELLEIVQKNWEFLISPHEYRSVKSGKKLSKEDQLEYRKGGIIADVVIGGKVYAPMGGGVTTAGTGITQSLHTNRILNKICNCYREIRNNPDKIKKSMEKNGITPPDKLEFELIDDPIQGLVCVEKKVKWGYQLNIKL